MPGFTYYLRACTNTENSVECCYCFKFLNVPKTTFQNGDKLRGKSIQIGRFKCLGYSPKLCQSSGCPVERR